MCKIKSWWGIQLIMVYGSWWLDAIDFNINIEGSGQNLTLTYRKILLPQFHFIVRISTSYIHDKSTLKQVLSIQLVEMRSVK